MKFFLPLFLMVLNQMAWSQVDESKSFVYLYSDSILYGKVEYKPTLFGENYFLIDSKKISVDNVKFYKADTIFYANTKDITLLGYSYFAIRIVKGKLNLFEEIKTNYQPPMMNMAGGMTGGGVTSTTYAYYNKGYGPLKKAKYLNLVSDLSDNTKSLNYLNKFKKARNIESILYAAGGATFIIGVISLIKKTANIPEVAKPNTSGSFALMGGGAGCMLAGYVFSISKYNHLKKAINEYNY